MKVIFLDIDGVLVNRRSLKERSRRRAVADPGCVAALNAILERTGAAIVLSSAWRFSGLEEMRLILNHWGVSPHLIGVTPDRTRREASGLYAGDPREAEIQQWLDEQKGLIEAFVILDDDGDMGHLAAHLVRTEFEIGLTPAQAEYAIAILEAQR